MHAHGAGACLERVCSCSSPHFWLPLFGWQIIPDIFIILDLQILFVSFCLLNSNFDVSRFSEDIQDHAFENSQCDIGLQHIHRYAAALHSVHKTEIVLRGVKFDAYLLPINGFTVSATINYIMYIEWPSYLVQNSHPIGIVILTWVEKCREFWARYCFQNSDPLELTNYWFEGRFPEKLKNKESMISLINKFEFKCIP